MKVDKRFHCFGCQADGDVINFTSRLFSITPREAALRLAEDFGVQYDSQTQASPVRRNSEISEAEIFRHRQAYVFSELVDYRNLLMQWSVQYAPASMDEEFHPLFREAICNLPQVEYQLDVLLSGTDAEKRTVVSDSAGDQEKTGGKRYGTDCRCASLSRVRCPRAEVRRTGAVQEISFCQYRLQA